MPEMDGYETMRAIREIDRFRTLPIIALTAKAMKEDRQKCIEAGASDYLAKPVSSEQLLSMLRVWLLPPRGPGDERTPGGRRPVGPMRAPVRERTAVGRDRTARWVQRPASGVGLDPEGGGHGRRSGRSTSCWWTTSRTTCSPWRRSWAAWG